MIALFAEGVDYPRPLTHDLVLDVAGAAGRSLERVEITALRDDVYEASLVFDDGGRVDSRASDAVALAMRASVDILVADVIVDEVGVQVADEQEEEVEKFREFLDHVSAEDFEEPEE
ncbi:BFN domain-containing protein [Dermacoccus barathri]